MSDAGKAHPYVQTSSSLLGKLLVNAFQRKGTHFHAQQQRVNSTLQTPGREVPK